MIELTLESPVPFLPLYLDENETFVILDVEDYDWAVQYRWRACFSRGRPGWRRKVYAVRSTRRGGRINRTLFLHKLVCWRAYGPPPTPLHTIGDHTTGNTWDCRREKLRWATRSENRMNIDGAWDRQMRLELEQ